jgi:hypothetical protein
MKNQYPPPQVSLSDRCGENDLDNVHLFVGEEIQWRIFLAVASYIALFSELLYVGMYIMYDA